MQFKKCFCAILALLLWIGFSSRAIAQSKINFCETTGRLNQKSISELPGYKNGSCGGDCESLLPWVLLASDQKNDRENGWIRQKYAALTALKTEEFCSSTDTLESCLKKNLNARYGQKEKERMRALLKALAQARSPELAHLRVIAPALCHQPIGSDCPGAVNSVFNFMSPDLVGGENLSPRAFAPKILFALPESYTAIFTDSRFIRPLVRAALKVLEHFDKKSGGKFESIEKLLIAEFKNEVATEHEAEELAWMVLGFYGTRGPSTEVLRGFFTGTQNITLSALSVLFAGYGRLETEQPGVTLPSQITTSCPVQKPYHFWMGAFVARKLKKEGHSDESAIEAADLFSRIYLFSGSTALRNKEKEPSLDPSEGRNIGNRVDLVHTYEGARWATTPSSTALSLDQKINESYQRAIRKKKTGRCSLGPTQNLFEKLIQLPEHWTKWNEDLMGQE